MMRSAESYNRSHSRTCCLEVQASPTSNFETHSNLPVGAANGKSGSTADVAVPPPPPLPPASMGPARPTGGYDAAAAAYAAYGDATADIPPPPPPPAAPQVHLTYLVYYIHAYLLSHYYMKGKTSLHVPMKVKKLAQVSILKLFLRNTSAVGKAL